MELSQQRLSSFGSDEQDQLIQVNVPQFKKEKDRYYYEILLTKTLDQDAKHQVEKTYADFEQLHFELENMGFINLPKIPESFFFSTSGNLDSRRVQLQAYIKTLCMRKDTQYSLPVRRFLLIDNFCPELAYKHPYRIMLLDFTKKERFVNHCVYLDDKDLLLVSTCINDKSPHQIELYALNYCAESRNKDGKVVNINILAENDKQSAKGKQNERLRLERLLVIKDLPAKVIGIQFYTKQSQVCIGLQSGIILTFVVQTQPESFQQQQQSECIQIPFKQLSTQNYPSQQILQASYFSTVAGNIVFPELEEFEGPSVQQLTLLKIVLKQNPIQLHRHLKSLAVSQEKGFLFTTDSEAQNLVAYDLNKQKPCGALKYTNCRVQRLLVQDFQSRLFSSTKEGLLLFFDISAPLPQITFQMKVVKTPGGKNHIKQMQLCNIKNLLFLRLKSHDILVIQLIGSHAFKSTIIERIKFQSIAQGLSQFQWLEHLNCYVEGTQKGLLKIREPENAGECRFILASKTIEQIETIHYNRVRGLMFVASRDGRFQAWKLPSKWRDEKVDKMEEEFMLERRTLARQTMASSQRSTMAE